MDCRVVEEPRFRTSHATDPHRLEIRGMVVSRLRRKCVRPAGEELPLRVARGIGCVLAW